MEIKTRKELMCYNDKKIGLFKKWVSVDDVLKFLNDENYGRQDMIDIISEESTIKSQKP